MKYAFSLLTAFQIMLCVATNAIAEDCGKAGDTYSIIACQEQRYANADKELNDIYRQAMNTLPNNEKQKLQQAQKSWLKYRDASIEFVIEKNRDTRSYGRIVIGDYKATLVEKRVKELKHILKGPEGTAVDL